LTIEDQKQNDFFFEDEHYVLEIKIKIRYIFMD